MKMSTYWGWWGVWLGWQLNGGGSLPHQPPTSPHVPGGHGIPVFVQMYYSFEQYTPFHSFLYICRYVICYYGLSIWPGFLLAVTILFYFCVTYICNKVFYFLISCALDIGLLFLCFWTDVPSYLLIGTASYTGVMFCIASAFRINWEKSKLKSLFKQETCVNRD